MFIGDKKMKITQFTMPGGTHNEDAVYACEKFGFVIDGATGLLKENISNMPSDAQWFSHTLKKYLIENLPNYTFSIKDIIKNAIVEIDKIYNQFKGSENVKSKPSAGIAIFRIVGDFFEYFVLGDCSLIILDNNKVKHLKLDDISKLDSKNLNKMKAIAKEKNINVIEARNLINDDLVKTRLSQNTKGSYWIISDNTEAVDHALCGNLPLKNITQIVGLSDGFSQIFDKFNYCTKEELLQTLCNTSIEDIYKTLWHLQEEDKFCNKYPRFKIRDDASIFNINF